MITTIFTYINLLILKEANPLHIQSLKTSHKSLPSIREEEPLRVRAVRNLIFFAPHNSFQYLPPKYTNITHTHLIKNKNNITTLKRYV